MTSNTQDSMEVLLAKSRLADSGKTELYNRAIEESSQQSAQRFAYLFVAFVLLIGLIKGLTMAIPELLVWVDVAKDGVVAEAFVEGDIIKRSSKGRSYFTHSIKYAGHEKELVLPYIIRERTKVVYSLSHPSSVIIDDQPKSFWTILNSKLEFFDYVVLVIFAVFIYFDIVLFRQFFSKSPHDALSKPLKLW